MIALSNSSESSRLSRSLSSVCRRLSRLESSCDEAQERLFQLDRARRNNLVFYGVRSGGGEGGEECEGRIRSLLRVRLLMTREVPLSRVEKLRGGPSFRGVRPIRVSFGLFGDREEVLRKAPAMLKGTGVYVTEDFSRKVLRHREELARFARAEKRARGDPSLRCVLQYDRLFVGREAFLYNEVEGRVERVKMTKEVEERERRRHRPLPLTSRRGEKKKVQGQIRSGQRSPSASSSSSSESSLGLDIPRLTHLGNSSSSSTSSSESSEGEDAVPKEHQEPRGGGELSLVGGRRSLSRSTLPNLLLRSASEEGSREREIKRILVARRQRSPAVVSEVVRYGICEKCFS